MSKKEMIDFILENLCPYELNDSDTTIDEAREELEQMSYFEVQKIYQEYLQWMLK